MTPKQKHQGFFFLFLFLLITKHTLLFGQSGAIGNPLFFESPIDTSVEIHEYSSIFIDSSKAMGVQDVLDALNEQTLTPSDEVPDFGKFNQGRYAYWQYFEIQTSPAFEAQLVYFRTVSVRDSILLFQFEGDQMVHRIYNGYMIKRSNEKLLFQTSDRYATPLVLAPGKHYRFLIRLTSAPGFRNSYNAYLYPKTHDFTAQRKPAMLAFLLYGGFFAILLFMAFFSLMQYFQNKDKSFLFYALYLLSILCFTLRSFGFKNPIFEITPPFLVNYWYYFIFQIFIYLNYILFAVYFLETKTRMPRLHRFIQFFLISLGMLFFVDRSLHQIDVFWAWQFNVWARFLINMISFIFLLLLLKTRDKLALFIIVGSVLLILSLLATQFISFDLTRSPGFLDISDLPAILGTLLEIFCFALGLGYKSRLTEADKIKAENKLLIKAKEADHLQELNELKTNLYNNITHEFRTPLTVILGMTENLKTKSEEQQLEGLIQPLHMIERNGQHLLHLVNEMLDLAKIDSGNLELKLQQADVIPFIKYLTESFHSLAAEKHIDLPIQAAEQSLVMDFDADKLAVIVSNLLSNAIKFTPEGGEVLVRLSAEAAYFFISVKDNGIGIAPEDIPFVFDRFYQADQAAVRRYPGTGIGLALTKELVALMNGTIQVASEPGKGSEFIVQLPIHRKALLAESPVMVTAFSPSLSPSDRDLQEEPSHGAADLPLVLIIEDHADVARYIGTCLQGKYQYVHVANGKLGIETAFEKIPDLIICDVMMPEKDGFEVCATLKADERTNHIPIIMLTARVTIEDRLAGLARGADAYLAKPFEKAELLIRLHQLFELRKTLQKKYSEQLFIDPATDTTVMEEDPFLARARAIVLAALEDDNFSLNELSEKLYLSRSQVHRKIKAVTGMSTAVFIRTIRLQEAKKLLVSTPLTISEIAYQVGFKSPVYFSQMFRQTFGESPSDIRK